MLERASFPRFPASTAPPQPLPLPSGAHTVAPLQSLQRSDGVAPEGSGRGWGGRLGAETSLFEERG